MTNYEYIVSLREEELFDYLLDMTICDKCKYYENRAWGESCPQDGSDCKKEFLKWLKQEREE